MGEILTEKLSGELTATLVTPTTDLTPFIGVRVRVERTLYQGHRETRYVYFGVFESLSHSNGKWCGGPPHCGGMLREELYGYRHGGLTGFDLPYGNATIKLAPAL